MRLLQAYRASEGLAKWTLDRSDVGSMRHRFAALQDPAIGARNADSQLCRVPEHLACKAES